MAGRLTANSLGLSLPNAPNDEQKATYERLRTISGPQFDRQFAAHMAEDHKKDIAKFEQQVDRQTPLSPFAKLSLPTLREHLQIAENIARSTGAGR